jgi:hypothetical protein
MCFTLEPTLTNSEDKVLNISSNPPSSQLSKVKLLIRKLKFANSELWFTSLDFHGLLGWIRDLRLTNSQLTLINLTLSS